VRALLDTCTVAELRHPKGNPAVRMAVATFDDDDLFLSVLTLGEVAKGIHLLRDGRKKRELTAWLIGLERLFADRILPVDREISNLWGELTARAQKVGTIIPAIDGLLAATALRHGLHLMTRNTRHFEATGVLIMDPWG
jgi:predicted nucleic acid-binding protein